MPQQTPFPPDPAAVDAVIMRELCTECGEASFGYVTADNRGAISSLPVVEYHADACPVLANGPHVIATMPRSAIELASQVIGGIFGWQVRGAALGKAWRPATGQWSGSVR
jgi:hypothetical protein